jgi:hypothetical protein
MHTVLYVILALIAAVLFSQTINWLKEGAKRLTRSRS